MSVERSPPDSSPRTAQQPPVRFETPEKPATADPIPDRAPLAARIERTCLQLRVATLERELQAREASRQAIIDQYERQLQSRQQESEPSDTSRLRRFIGRFLE